MVRNLFKGIFLFSFMVFMYGCASKGIEVRAYKEDRPRVDQSLDGNRGYLLGTAPEEAPRKPTRRIYVLEVSKAAKETAEEKAALAPEPDRMDSTIDPSLNSNVVQSSDEDAYTTNVSPRIEIPSFDDMPETTIDPSAKTVEYTVDKDDTLQKISKKFYNSHGKWTKIYEFNKEKIKDPDRIQPGTVLTIPLE